MVRITAAWISPRWRKVSSLQAVVPLQDRADQRVHGAARRGRADLLALEVGQALDRRILRHHEIGVGDQVGEDDLGGDTLGSEPQARHRASHDRDVDRSRDQRPIDLGELGHRRPFRLEAFGLEKLAFLQHQPDRRGGTARPIAGAQFLRIGSGARRQSRARQRK
jgi:hypothetical protein